MQESEDQKATLKIGAVARLTGVSVHTLRKWEDRYGAVEPRRTAGGERVYTRTDLERLGLIKRLADTGLALREIARMSLEELERTQSQVATASGATARRAPGRVRVALLGSGVAAMLGRRAVTPALLEVVASADTLAELETLLGDRPVDVLVYECPTVARGVRQDLSEMVRRVGARGAVVVYGFGARSDLATLQPPDVVTLRAPADAAALEQAAVGLIHSGTITRGQAHVTALEPDAEVPEPRISREVVARVARTAPRMRCECPHHLADIVLSLRAFEEYSAECESRNAEDAELHHFLWKSAAEARALFEDAIERVAEAEGISLEE